MPSVPTSPTAATSPAAILMVATREQYETCRIQVPDLAEALPAIRIGNNYYSFLKSAEDAIKAFALMIKLSYRGEAIAVVHTPKGYGLWGYEPQAQPVRSTPATPTAAIGQCKILVASDQFSPCSIRASDLNQSLVAIQHQDRYYSLFRQESEPEKLLSLIAKICQGGDDMVVTKTKLGWVCFIYEPSAVLLTAS